VHVKKQRINAQEIGGREVEQIVFDYIHELNIPRPCQFSYMEYYFTIRILFRSLVMTSRVIYDKMVD
jgi:hypothetical protein